ncbi:hypothetical protein [Salinimicrobium sediminilitoris]|uniref:hypothetical protein n=1 Tax=Salinimicrobium sediminilitoris TaxID=2876715 RepID=UPI001E3EE83B|nr:hypothetical protein [Salinimicrobium sediminilitoris]MCC8358384.1 hypothetical protein [Salinimicrobium sediminilitoris]
MYKKSDLTDLQNSLINKILKEYQETIIDQSIYFRCRKLVIDKGAEEYKKLSNSIKKKVLNRILQKGLKDNFLDQTFRILGYGHTMTSYITAFLPLNVEQRAFTNTLGSKANLLVTIYDIMLDEGCSRNRILNEKYLRQFIHQEKEIAFFSKKGLLGPILKNYFVHIHQNSYQHNENVIKLLKNKIWEMYIAENNTQSTNRNIDLEIWKKKSVYPFLVMALPGLLCLKKPPTMEYFKWLFSFGELIGLLDDIVDYNEDLANRQYNILTSANYNSLNGIERDFMKRFKNVKKWWDIKAPAEAFETDEKYLLLILILSWFRKSPIPEVQ